MCFGMIDARCSGAHKKNRTRVAHVRRDRVFSNAARRLHVSVLLVYLRWVCELFFGDSLLSVNVSEVHGPRRHTCLSFSDWCTCVAIQSR